MPKTKTEDRRGAHQRTRPERGLPMPQPSRGCTEWARRLHEKEAELEEAAARTPQQPLICRLPWQIGVGDGSAVTYVGEGGVRHTVPVGAGCRAMRSTGRALFVQLMLHERRGVVEVVRRARRGDANTGFWGILELRVPAEKRAAFDAGLVPSAQWARAQGALAEAERAPQGERAATQLKTVQKIWQMAGLIERTKTEAASGELLYFYDADTAERLRQQMARKPNGRASPVVVAAPSLGVAATEPPRLPSLRFVLGAMVVPGDGVNPPVWRVMPAAAPCAAAMAGAKRQKPDEAGKKEEEEAERRVQVAERRAAEAERRAEEAETRAAAMTMLMAAANSRV